MDVGKRYCAICGKEKQTKFLEFANINVFIECECEVLKRQQQEKKDMDFALKTSLRLRNKSSKLLPLYEKASFSTMTVDSENEKAVKAGKYILDCLLKNKDNEPKNSLVLQGNRGSGKTFIASAVINDFNRQYPVSDARLMEIIKERNNCFNENEFTPLKSPCKFINEMDLYALYYDNFNYSKINGPVNEFKKCEKLLVIDDVGSSGFESNRIFALYHNILDYRYSNRLPVIITTNLPKKELCTYIGERAFDRLRADSYFIDLTSSQSRR